MNKIRIGIIGAGGYAQKHLASIRICEQEGICKLGAVVIRTVDKKANEETEAALINDGVNIYRNSGEMFEKERGGLDIISIPVGIDQHADLSVKALKSGYHVFCEKPAAGTTAEARRMKDAADKTGRILAIGFQNIFSPSIQRIKKLTLQGDLGRLLKASTFVLWPRTSSYYNRNGWAGKMMTNKKWIYDSPIQNATSHFLNNMLYIAGPTADASADLTGVYGENYRAQDIDAPDTQYLRVTCKNGAILSHTATHAVSGTSNPVTRYIYERGKIEWTLDDNGRTRVYDKKGENDYVLAGEFDNGGGALRNNIYAYIINAIAENRIPLSNINNSIQQVVCVNKSFESSGGGCIPVPGEYLDRLVINKGEDYNIVIKGIEKVIRDMYDKELGFYEYGLPWAMESKTVLIS